MRSLLRRRRERLGRCGRARPFDDRLRHLFVLAVAAHAWGCLGSTTDPSIELHGTASGGRAQVAHLGTESSDADGIDEVEDFARARALARALRMRAREAPSDDPFDPFDPQALDEIHDAITSLPPSGPRGQLALHAAVSVLSRDLRDRPRPDVESQFAQALLERARRDGETSNQLVLSAEAAGRLGQLLHSLGRDGEAIVWTERALLSAQRAGAEVARIPWLVQASTILREQGELDAAIDRHAEAVELVTRHRPLLASRASGAEAPAQLTRIREVYVGYVDLLLRRAAGTSDSDARTRDLVAARDTFERFKVAELRDYFEDECVDRYRGQIETVDRATPHALVLYPILLPDRLELLVSGEFGIDQTTVAVPREAVEASIRQLRRLLVKRTTNQYRRHARQLYDWLVRPIESRLGAPGVETLVFVPDGSLRTIPVAALHDGDGFLIERIAVATTPGLELTDPRPIQNEGLTALLGGLSIGREEFESLPYVRQELAEVRRLVGGELLLDEGFRADRLETLVAERDFDLVHLATHARFDERGTSGFLLTHDGRLGIDRLAMAVGGLRYREKPIELLVLSACETARGNDRAALGLSGIAIRAGARSAIGSLWMVNDEATAQLLIRFYEVLREPGSSRARAMRAAQLDLLADETFRHPAYWSAFLLLNSWL